MKHGFTIYIEHQGGGFSAWFYDGEFGVKHFWSTDKKKARKKATHYSGYSPSSIRYVDTTRGKK